MPLAAHASWQGSTLHLAAALGHVDDPTQPLLTAHVERPVADADAAETLGAQAVAALHAAGARKYLAA
jgi:hydroxymethylbilane synthase